MIEAASPLSPLPPAVPRRILVLRAGALGDTLLALPALAAIRQGYPGARLILVGNPAAGRLLLAAGHVDECHSFDARWVADLYSDAALSPDLRAQLAGIHLAVVWSRSPESPAADALRRLWIPTLAAPSFPPSGIRRHLCDHLLDTLAPLGLPAVAPVPRLSVPDADLAFAHDFWRVNGLDGATVVALHVGSGGSRKNWPAERFAAVADRLAESGTRVLLVSGPADEAQTDAFRRSTRNRVVVAESPRLGELTGLLARADAYLGNDSGVSHLATAVGTPTVAIFGPTDPALWAPRGASRVIVLWRGREWTAGSDPSGEAPSLGIAADEWSGGGEQELGALDQVGVEAVVNALDRALRPAT